MTSYSESWLTGPKATNLYTRTYRPPSDVPVKAVVVFLHGFASHIDRYDEINTALSSRGLLVFTFDQRGWGHTVFNHTNKSTHSSYGVTGGWDQQMTDVSWALEYAKREYAEKEGVGIVLMGHSMGGGEALGFITQDPGLPEREYIQAVIASSPWITLTKEPNTLLRWIGEKLSLIFPSMLFPAEVKPETLSRDETLRESVRKDPMVLPKGSLLTLRDSLNKGDELLTSSRLTKWPKQLPLLILHGSADEVTSPKSSKAFHDKNTCDKKRYKLFEGAYHEIHNDIGTLKQEYADEIMSFVEEHFKKTGA